MDTSTSCPESLRKNLEILLAAKAGVLRRSLKRKPSRSIVKNNTHGNIENVILDAP